MTSNPPLCKKAIVYALSMRTTDCNAGFRQDKAKLETHRHSLEVNVSPAGRVSFASQDIVGGLISPNINIATPNLVSLRRP